MRSETTPMSIAETALSGNLQAAQPSRDVRELAEQDLENVAAGLFKGGSFPESRYDGVSGIGLPAGLNSVLNRAMSRANSLAARYGGSVGSGGSGGSGRGGPYSDPRRRYLTPEGNRALDGGL